VTRCWSDDLTSLDPANTLGCHNQQKYHFWVVWWRWELPAPPAPPGRARHEGRQGTCHPGSRDGRRAYGTICSKRLQMGYPMRAYWVISGGLLRRVTPPETLSGAVYHSVGTSMANHQMVVWSRRAQDEGLHTPDMRVGTPPPPGHQVLRWCRPSRTAPNHHLEGAPEDQIQGGNPGSDNLRRVPDPWNHGLTLHAVGTHKTTRWWFGACGTQERGCTPHT
jgi:hypothetical protein